MLIIKWNDRATINEKNSDETRPRNSFENIRFNGFNLTN